MGFTEKAIKYFIDTQTEEKLKRNNITNDIDTIRVRHKIEGKVMQIIKELGGTMPEKLSTSEKSKK